MKSAVVFGGTSGIGLSVVNHLQSSGYDKIYVIARNTDELPESENVQFVQINLSDLRFQIPDHLLEAEALFITSGTGRLAFFKDLSISEAINEITVNEISVIKIIKFFYEKLSGDKPFYCGVMGSITGYINSPLYSVYSASKSAVCRFIECINTELEYAGSKNRILNCSPGHIEGTRFDGCERSELSKLKEITSEFVNRTFKGDTLFIPEYKEVYEDVILRYRNDPSKFGLESLEYKLNNRNILNSKPRLKVGYLSGTFDLFHVGHLNLLRRAKQYCDYLVVGVHIDARHKGKETFIPFEDRVEILKGISYVDQVIESCREDVDVYKKDIVKYDYLFVGSDYEGTERFRKYEEYFKGKGVKIIYFPYTEKVSSTKLREKISSGNKE